MGHPVWVLAGGLSMTTALLLWLGTLWTWGPVEQLAASVRRIHTQQEPGPVRGLPIHQDDEVGRIARAFDHLMGWTMRGHYEARQLRRTMDHRVQGAIRKATINLEKLAFRDALTGLANRRFFDDSLEPLFDSAAEVGEDLICIVMDMDNFKQVNDRLGHAVGDELLNFLGRLILASIRADDAGVRLGGDEFVILMPGASIDRAGQLTYNLAALFSQHLAHRRAHVGQVSLSMGVASLRQDRPTSGRQLVHLADQRLYAAKRNGKGCIVGI